MLQFQVLLHFLFYHNDQTELKKPLPSGSKTTDGTLWNTLYMIHSSRKVSVEYIRNEKQRKTSFAEYSTSYMAQEDLQQFTVNQQLIISL